MQIKYIATLSNVKEATLLGVADSGFWTQRLEPVGLTPRERDGRAQLVISAVDSKYMGVRFRELVIAVSAVPVDGPPPKDSLYLVHAFNSSRLFSLIERGWFSTPYYFSDIEVDAALPASTRVIAGGASLFCAEMRGGASPAKRESMRQDAEVWEGPIYLPRSKRDAGRRGQLFYAKLGGPANVYAFSQDDLLTIQPAPAAPVLQWLIESRFTPQEWLIRDRALHARSRTYRR